MKAAASEGPTSWADAADRDGVRRLLRGRRAAGRRREAGASRRRRATSARRTATTSSSARSSPGGSRAPGAAEPERRRDDVGPHDGAGVSTACASTSTAATRHGRESLRAEATVMDVNRQAWTAGAACLVHPSSRYVGLRSGAGLRAEGRAHRDRRDRRPTSTAARSPAAPSRCAPSGSTGSRSRGSGRRSRRTPRSATLESGAEPVRVRFEAKEGGPGASSPASPTRRAARTRPS